MSLINLELLHLVQLHIIWMWVHLFHWKQPLKPLYDITQIFRLLFSSKNGEMRSNKWNDGNKFAINASCLATFSEYWWTLFIESEKLLLEVKKLWKSRFLGYFSKAKREECNQKTWSVCNVFGIAIRSSVMWVRMFHRKLPPKVLLEAKMLQKFRYLE